MLTHRFLFTFGVVILSVAALCSINSCAHRPAKTIDERLSILQGLTTESTAAFAVLVPKESEIVYQVLPSDRKKVIKTITAQRYSQPHSDWAIDKFVVKGLEKQGPVYWLKLSHKNGQVIDQREFSTLDWSSDTLHFVAASCMDDSFGSLQQDMWKQVAFHKPQMIFMIGDNVYADKNQAIPGPASPEHLWNRYVATRRSLDIFKQDRLIPILAIWDDHDYGMNDGDVTYKHKDKSLQIFNVFFAQPSMDRVLQPGPGASFFIDGFQQGFAFMDNRFFRSPNNQKTSEETHWGKTQEQWLLSKLQSPSQPVWIINGDQIFGGYHKFESYEGNHPENFKKMMAEISRQPSPVIFLTGDRHLAEIMKTKPKDFAYTTYELTTSGIHAKTYPPSWDKTPNPRQVFGSVSSNYMMIASQQTAKGLKVHVRTMGPQNTVLDERTLEVTNNQVSKAAGF